LIIDKNHTAFFSGLDLENFSFSLEDKTDIEYTKLFISIEAAIKNSRHVGYSTFLCSMSRGFDLVCAQAVLKIRQEQNDIKLICVLPYKNHSYAGEWGRIHKAVRNAADGEVITSSKDDFTRDCYHFRDLFMLKNSSRIICYWDGQQANTSHIVHMAEKQGLSIYNLRWLVCSF